jgi:hypothetical protein
MASWDHEDLKSTVEPIHPNRIPPLQPPSESLQEVVDGFLIRDTPAPPQLPQKFVPAPPHAPAPITGNGDTNPKKKWGIAKSLVGDIPMAAVRLLGSVMHLGAEQYGAFNWRVDAVDSQTYIEAIRRHLDLWEAGEDNDPLVDPITGAKGTGKSHLGNIMACCTILFDSQLHGKLDDNRPKSPETVAFIKSLTEKSA